jgi:hypothetical protein
MARLTAKQRNALPASAFGLPKLRAYPMPDIEHAVVAKMDAERAYDSDLIKRRQYERIVSKANRIIERHIEREVARRNRKKNPSHADHRKAGNDALKKSRTYWERYLGHHRSKDLVDAYEWLTRAHVEMKYAGDREGLAEAKQGYEAAKAELLSRLRR